MSAVAMRQRRGAGQDSVARHPVQEISWRGHRLRVQVQEVTEYIRAAGHQLGPALERCWGHWAFVLKM